MYLSLTCHDKVKCIFQKGKFYFKYREDVAGHILGGFYICLGTAYFCLFQGNLIYCIHFMQISNTELTSGSKDTVH